MRKTSTIWFFLLLAAMPLMGTGCAVIKPPEKQPLNAVSVYVTDYGIHSAIVLPVNKTKFVEYSFGDWGWAVENRNMPWDGVGALLLSFQSAFGRIYLDADPATGLPQFHSTPNRIQRFPASRDDVTTLLAQLNERYDKGTRPVVYNEQSRIHWVRDHQHYSVLNNCNQLTTRSLQHLGLKVHGVVFSSSGLMFGGGEKIDPKALKVATHLATPPIDVSAPPQPALADAPIAPSAAPPEPVANITDSSSAE